MEVFSKTCVAVLAGGASRRFGAPKLLVSFAGTTLLDRALATATGSAADCAAVVTGAYHREMSEYLEGADPSGAPCRIVHNRQWEAGQATSVHAAVRFARAEGASALLVMVADQPRVTAAHLNALLWEYDQGSAQAYLSATDHGHGNPCIFDESLFDDLLALRGDEGARALFRTRRDVAARHVHFDDPYLFVDVDTPADLRRLEEAMARG